LAEAGLALLSSWAGGETGGETGGASAPRVRIERDPASGRDYLKLPLPEPALLARAVDALNALAALAASRKP
jgi:hypothetical protein